MTTPAALPVHLTPSAITKITTLLAEEGPETKLRVFVEGGGCAGLKYDFAIETEAQADDLTLAIETVTLLIDVFSLPYLQGATIDYQEDEVGQESFVIRNPNAKRTCGCGASFDAGSDEK